MCKKILLTSISYFLVLSIIFLNCTKKPKNCNNACANNQECNTNKTCGCPPLHFSYKNFCLPNNAKSSKYFYLPVNNECNSFFGKFLYFPNGFVPDTFNTYSIAYKYLADQSKIISSNNFSTFGIVDSNINFTDFQIGIPDSNNLFRFTFIKAKLNNNYDSIHFTISTTVQNGATNVVISQDSCIKVFYRKTI